MRIGTWNVANEELSEKQKEMLVGQDCDIWLLTEINPRWIGSDGKMLSFHCHCTKEVMEIKPNQLWAAVLSAKPFDKTLDDPHPASAAAVVNGITYCSSVLPWRSAKESAFPPIDSSLTVKTEVAIDSLLEKLPRSNLVWGGDWNHSFVGSEVVGSNDGRKYLLEAINELGLQVPTKGFLHRNGISNTIDHLAVPTGWQVIDANQVSAKGLSDHDAYWIEVQESVNA